MPEYRYGLRFRPAGLGAVPRGDWRLADAGCFETDAARHGVIVFDRPLTDREICAFELVWLPNAVEVESLATAVCDVMAEYGQRYLEFWDTERDLVVNAILGCLSRLKLYRICVGDEPAFCELVVRKLSEATQEVEA